MRSLAQRLAVVLAASTIAGCAGAPEPRLAATADATSEETPDWGALAAARLPLLAPCTRPNIEETLLCGTIEVWENRAAASGRRIGLEVVIVPAQSEDPPSDPVFVFEGGPGGAATKRAAGSVWAGRVRDRDIVLVDQRGTGGSNPLDCDLGGDGERPGELREMFPAAAVRECAKGLAERADVRLYTTEHHADDIEEVRRRLGYGPINIRGGSYGTDAMMAYAQRHPESTRTLFGIGSVSPLRSNMSERGVMAERTLRGIAGLCDADEACAAIAPSMAELATELLTRLDERPRPIDVADPTRPGERLSFELSRGWVAEILRLNLYFAFTTRALPWALHRAWAEDDWEPLVQLGVIVERMFKSNLATGVVLTVQCSEHMNFDLEGALASGAETPFGNYRLEQQLQGCAAWPHDRRPPLRVESPRVLDIPALFLSGAFDPVTPPVYSDEAMTLFPASRHVVLAEGQHGPFDLENSWECVHGMWADLLEAGSAEAVDASCAAEMHRPPFIVDGAEFSAYVAETLAPMAAP